MKAPKVRIAHDRFVKKTSGALVTTRVSITSRLSKYLLKKALHCFLISSLVFFLHALAANAQIGTFSATGSMITARSSQVATLLPNGKVLVAGGCYDNGGGCQVLASAELYDPTTGTFSATGSM